MQRGEKNLVNKSQKRHWNDQTPPFINRWAIKKLQTQVWRGPSGLYNC